MALPWPLLLLSLLLAAGYLALRPHKRGAVPAAKGALPFVGNAFMLKDAEQFAARLEGVAARLAQKSGLCAIHVPSITRLFGRRILLVDDVVAAKQILARRPLTFDRPATLLKSLRDRLDRPNAPSVFSALGRDAWGRARRLTSPAFSHANVTEMRATVFDLAASLVQRWVAAAEAQEIVDAKNDFSELTFSVIGRVGFGLPIDTVRPDAAALTDPRPDAPQPPPSLLADIKEPTQQLGAGLVIPWRKYTDPIFRRDEVLKAREQSKRLIQYLYRLLAYQAEHEADATEATSNSLISKLSKSIDNEAQDAKRRTLSKDEIIANFLTFFFAGVDTTAIGLSWAVCYLASDPELHERVAAESRSAGVMQWIEAELERRERGSPSGAENEPKPLPLDEVPLADLLANDTSNPLKLARGVFLESLRLHPPAPILGAELAAPSGSVDVGVTGGTQTLQKGQMLFMLLRRMMTDPRHTARATEFVPERWGGRTDLEPDAAHKAFLQEAMFGGGPRVCPGRHLSILEATITLSAIAGLLHLAPADASSPMPSEVTRFTNQPDEARVRVSVRA